MTLLYLRITHCSDNCGARAVMDIVHRGATEIVDAIRSRVEIPKVCPSTCVLHIVVTGTMSMTIQLRGGKTLIHIEMKSTSDNMMMFDIK